MAKVDAVIDQLSSVIVASNLSCITNVVNNVGLSVTHSGNVIVHNVTVVSDGEASSARCAQATTFTEGPLTQNIGNLLDQMLHAADDMREPLVTLKATIAQSVSVDVVNACAARAVNSVIISFANVQGDVLIEDVNIAQRASAALSQCLAQVSIQVGDGTTQTLRQYIQGNAHWLDVTSPDGQNYPAASGCSDVVQARRTLIVIGVSISAATALVLGVLALMLAFRLRKSF